MKAIKLGFTGTRHGMTLEQREALVKAFTSLHHCGLVIVEFHQGMCVGADEQAVGVCRFMPAIEVHHHPCDMTAMQAKDLILPGDVVYEEKPPLMRNQDILKACDTLIATPREMEEIQRSGTWSTLRHANDQKLDTILILPDGSTNIGDIAYDPL